MADCYSCTFWQIKKRRAREGMCKRNAPAYMDETEALGLWPWTKSTDFCGEFEARKSGTPKPEPVDERLHDLRPVGNR